MTAILLADRRDEPVHPGLRDLLLRASRQIEREALDEELAAQLAREPLGLLLAAGQDRLIHQVVTEDRGAAGTATGDRLPETGLHLPAVLLRQSIVPGGDVLLVVARQPGQIEVQVHAFRQLHNLSESGQRGFVRLIRLLHELAELKVEADDVGAEILHLPEILLDLRPLRCPVVLQQPALLVVVVVEAPRDKRAAIVQNETAFVIGDSNEFHRSRALWTPRSRPMRRAETESPTV